jgi:hypothetical protein
MSIQSIDNLLKNNLSFLDNQYVIGGLSLAVILYSVSDIPKNESVYSVADNLVFKVIMFLMILFIARLYPVFSVLLAVAYISTLLAGKAKSSYLGAAGVPSKKLELPSSTRVRMPVEEDLDKREHQFMDYVDTTEVARNQDKLIGSNTVNSGRDDLMMDQEEDIIFDEQSLMALREKVRERQQNSKVMGREDAPEYALV